MIWDVFISHASEDKESVAIPLYECLTLRGLNVWLDQHQIKLGDKLSESINQGLALSRFGVVIISEHFFKKDYAKRELQAFTARETASGNYVIPVLHGIDHSILRNKAPLIADNFAGSTDRGIEILSQQIYDTILQSKPDQSSDNEVRYFPNFEFPEALIDAAVEAIDALCLSQTWKALEVVDDMTDPSIWMGSQNETLIKILYDLYAPIVYFDYRKYDLDRSINSYGPVQRYRYILLEELSLALTRDREIAASGNLIEYTPRVPNWRLKRQELQQRYWWQGLTQKRLHDARTSFLKPIQNKDGFELRGFLEFREIYNKSYAQGDTHQKPLGLLGNSLFGFDPVNRPVFWRILHFWKACYILFKSNLLEGQLNSSFPSHLDLMDPPPENCQLFETKDETTSALAQYWDDMVAGSIRLNLRQAQEE